MNYTVNSVWAAGLSAALVLSPFGAAAAIADDNKQQQQQSGQQAQSGPVGTTGAVAAASVEDIVDNPQSFYGKKVTVSGSVGDVFRGRAFNIEEEGVIDADDELLVLAPKDAAAISEDAKVQVRGTVRRVVGTDLQRDYGATYWTYWDLDPNFFVQYENRPVLFAESIDIRR